MASPLKRSESVEAVGNNSVEGLLSPARKSFASKIPRRKEALAAAKQLADNQAAEEPPSPVPLTLLRSAERAKKDKVDRNQQFIKELEEKKRKEKEAEAAEADRQRKLRLKLRKSILQRAAAVRDAPTKDEVPEEPAPIIEETAEEKKIRAAAQKKLLLKQQAVLEALQAKKRKEQVDEEVERQKSTKKKEAVRKAALGSQEVSSRMQDALEKFNSSVALAAAGSAIAAVRLKKDKEDDAIAMTPEEKERRLMQQEAIKRKQVEYLAKLAEERKQKALEDEEKRDLLEKKRQKVREEALLRHEAAKQAAAERAAAAPAVVAEPEVDEKPKVNVEAMVSRLSKLKTTEAQLVPEAKDFASWKKRNGLAPDTKVFCITGWYPVIKEALEARGWFHNPDRSSPYFDLKWALKSDDLKNVKLNEDQLVNHFMQNTAITTKVGLLHNLRNITWFLSEDIDSFFPRAYDLNEPSDMQAYIQDYRYIHAEGMLKRLRTQGSQPVNLGVLDVLLSVCRKRQEILPDDILDNADACGIEPVVTDLQWEVLQRCSISAPGAIRASFQYTKPPVVADPNAPATELSPSEQREDARLARKQEKYLENAFAKEKVRLNALLSQMEVPSPNVMATVNELLQSLEALCPQFHLNGVDCKNVWIVKPAGMSRGRGIRVFNQLAELLAYADVENHKECQWIVQKYIENPLLVCNRKFDIRQWVFVTSWNPLTVWFYMDCYLRFSSEEYQMNDLSDQFVHLTNNSIQKFGDNFYKAYSTEDGSMTVEGNMWHSDDLQAYLSKRYGLDPETNESIWLGQIQPRMKQIVSWSLQCVQDTVAHRKNSCELYGYDFMIDEQFKPWLIEVNSSPACDYSTAITKRYVETGLTDILKVMLDVREYDASKRRNSQTKMPKPDTGRWENIVKAEYIAKPLSSFGGSDFEVRGKKLSKKSQRAINQACQPRQANPATDAPDLTPDDPPLEDGLEEAMSDEAESGPSKADLPPEVDALL
ncbi:tubulin-tyrosine ligase family [Achlya hypogyna]|uniref:Tubulin-tyrosine ligase family n=1 Tax=Achlya hypogyna TaxID=1202772 RepID=A0A1V9ZU13_ACHHY|nr:tubulin-tyrosine ligase family [Achlya hypogyna]